LHFYANNVYFVIGRGGTSVNHCDINRSEIAKSLFKQGYNCSQSVFATYADLYGIDRELALKLSASFGGGMGRMREVCGCVSGMFMLAGLETGCTDGADKDKKAANYQMVQHLADEFKKKSGGSIICRELLAMGNNTKVDSTPTPSERTKEYYKKRPCIQLVQDACEIIEKELLGKSE
jgi:C_GCAxxG_C_C family probable redox protein